LEVQLDEEALDPFELNDPRLSELGDRNEELRLSLLQYDLDGPPPPADVIEQGYSELTALQAAMGPHLKDVAAELRRWQDRLPDPKEGPDAAGPTTEDLAMQQQLVTRLAETLTETHEDFTQDQADTEQAVEQLTQTPRNQAWEQLHELVGTAFRRTLADLFVIQTQIRVYRLEIEALQVSQENALRTAWQNRLDLMNARGNVIDGFRRVEVAADGLQGDLDFTLEAELATDPGRSNPLRFDSSASRYRAGVAFDSPLNRLAERNTYRAAQLAYQRARRQFMAVEDSIALDIRRDLRVLAFSRFQFETTRQQVITAARQVEEAQFNLRSTQEPNSSLTRDLLVALQRLLNAKNSMILSWVNYETSRMNLARDLGIMQIDGDGTWTNEHDTSFQTGEATEEEARGDTREQAGARGYGSAPADGAELIPAQPDDTGNVESLPPPQ
jgi:hypothetical protein